MVRVVGARACQEDDLAHLRDNIDKAFAPSYTRVQMAEFAPWQLWSFWIDAGNFTPPSIWAPVSGTRTRTPRTR